MLFLNLSAMALSKTLTICGLSLANAEFRWQLTMLFYRIAGTLPAVFKGTTNTANREA